MLWLCLFFIIVQECKSEGKQLAIKWIVDSSMCGFKPFLNYSLKYKEFWNVDCYVSNQSTWKVAVKGRLLFFIPMFEGSTKQVIPLSVHAWCPANKLIICILLSISGSTASDSDCTVVLCWVWVRMKWRKLMDKQVAAALMETKWRLYFPTLGKKTFFIGSFYFAGLTFGSMFGDLGVSRHRTALMTAAIHTSSRYRWPKKK